MHGGRNEALHQWRAWSPPGLTSQASAISKEHQQRVLPFPLTVESVRIAANSCSVRSKYNRYHRGLSMLSEK